MSNSIILPESKQASPFDSIRHFDDQGKEFWTARELMEWLGFSKWDKFQLVVLDAIADLEILEAGSAFDHITQSGKLVKRAQGGGNTLVDYNLSRLGCYHVALACKTRTLEVAAARRYFATKTREAEILVPLQNDRIRELELMVQLAEAEKHKALAEQRLLDTRDTILRIQPKAIADRILGVTEIAGETKIQTVVVNEYGQILDAGNTVTKSKLAERYGFVSKTGKPDTRLVTDLIDEAILRGAISDPWKDSRVVAAPGFDAELVPTLDRFYQANPVQRQRWMGETN